MSGPMATLLLLALLALLLAAVPLPLCGATAAPGGDGGDAASAAGGAAAAAVFSAGGAVRREVHAFFYLWYGTPAVDGRWLHWDHALLAHWNADVAARYPHGKYDPDAGDIGATFMPQRGMYSSCDAATLRSQMSELSLAGVDVVVASWWPSGRPDGQGVDTDRCVGPLLDAAAAVGDIKVAWHLEPYPGRDPVSVRADLAYIVATYGKHPAFYLRAHNGRNLPLAYVYDSYHNPASEWTSVLSQGGPNSIRGTEVDFLCLALYLNAGDERFAKDAGFDGAYSYFAAEGFSFGSTPRNWPAIAQRLSDQELMWVPSVGPGYDDTRLRPWNGANTKPRNGGQYYKDMWAAAVDSVQDTPLIVSLTSANEWGEGTQLEPAVAFTTAKGERLQDYGDAGPNLYMDLTRVLAENYRKRAEAAAAKQQDEAQRQRDRDAL